MKYFSLRHNMIPFQLGLEIQGIPLAAPIFGEQLWKCFLAISPSEFLPPVSACCYSLFVLEEDLKGYLSIYQSR